MSTDRRIEARKLKGFRDYTPEFHSVRQSIIDKTRAQASVAGFEEINTPALEYLEVLLGAGGTETDKEVYRFEDHGGRDVAMRFDLTVPFARYVAEHQGTMIFPFKKLQIGDVWRGEKPQKGRYRQFCQSDLDIVGADTIAADVEIVGCIFSTLNEILPVDFTVTIGNRNVLSALINALLPEVGSAEKESKVLIAIDKLAKIGLEKVTTLIAEVCTDRAAIDLFLKTITPDPTNGVNFIELETILAADKGAVDSLKRYQKTIAILGEVYRSTKGKIVADLRLARGLGYYTGIVFEGTIDSLKNIGSISGGGRYNKLVSRFSSQEIPGVGGSVGVDRLLAAFEEMGLDKTQQRQGIFIALTGDDCNLFGFEILQTLRGKNLLSDIATKGNKLAQQFKYADRRRYRHAITVGPDEAASRTVNLKDLESGEEVKGLTIENLIKKLC